ncbi:MAG TPA: hypothetical protein VGO63_00135 [Candidatus Paceibacterota bacterium]|jgi:hypothetical protein|nr:hypothetical protein [Candidatus Paceibacterota bacterium]
MRFPFKIASQEKNKGLEIWNKQFVSTGRYLHEGIWRRTQAKDNKSQSRWKSKKDARWRVVHFIDNYGITCKDKIAELVLKGVYLKINHSLPKLEAERIFNRIVSTLKKENIAYKNTENGLSASRGDLKIKIRIFHPQSNKLKKHLPIALNYNMVDIEITGGEIDIKNERKYYPWKIIKKGFRVPLRKGHPRYLKDINEILKYQPFQIELGCGPSTEIGIYPLSYLHKIYQTTNADKTFVFGNEDKLFETIIKNPSDFYLRATKIISQSWLAVPNSSFYRWLQCAYKKGLVVGPVITNNYDGIVSRLGIPEFYVRKFTDQFLIPKIKFNKKAKSLLVIGSHADRRLVQHAARKQNLKVIFVDPEQYIDDNGKVFSYKIEAPQDNDIIFKSTASTFVNLF